MLPAANRMRRSADFDAVVRTGIRARRGAVVVHFTPGFADGEPPRAGLVVGKGVGTSVVRHRVSRRLRAQLAQRLPALPVGSATVVRALPAAAAADSAELGRDLQAAFERLVRR